MRAARRVITIVLLVQAGWMTVAAVGSSFLGRGLVVAFGCGVLAVLAVLLGFTLVWQRDDARRDQLLRTGVRAPAVLVSSRATRVVFNNRRVLVHTFESGDGVRATAHAIVHLPVGTAATVAHDPREPRRAVVVEDLDALPGRP